MRKIKMSTKQNWYTLKFGLKNGLIRDIESQNNPLNHQIDEYLEGRINLRCTLIHIMRNFEKGIPLNDNIKEFIKIKSNAKKKVKSKIFSRITISKDGGSIQRRENRLIK